MSRIFVSWGSPDKDVATRLVNRFRSAGHDLFEYTDDMRAGDQIHDRFLEEIHLAEVALLCLSDKSVAREWVQREYRWCLSDLINHVMPMKRVIVVEVNTLSEINVPSLLRESWLHRFNIYQSGDLDRGLGVLLAEVSYILGSPKMMAISQKRVFLAHAREDKDRVRALYKQIKQRGFNPWLDEKDLIAGQIWRIEIQKAIHEASVFIACLSQNSVRKRGFVQTEFRLALAAYGERPPESIYLIPVKLDECEVPDLQIPNQGISIRDFHWLDLWQEGGFEQLIQALEKGLGTIG